MATPWEQYLKSVGLSTSGPTDFFSLAQRGFGTGKLFEIGGGAVSPQYDTQALNTAAGSYTSSQDVLAALGQEEKEDKGLLSSALGILDKPRAVVFSGLKELSDAVGSGDASWGDFTRQVSEGYGAGDTELLKFREGESRWLKYLKAAGAFAGDVLADPTTYLTLGAGGIAKKAGVQATEAIAKKALQEGAEKIGREAVEELATRGLDDVARKALLDAGDDAIFEKAAQRLGADMAEGYAKSRSRGLLESLTKNLGDDAGYDIFENTVPKVMQGGIGFRIPLLKDEYGLTRTLTVGKGGSLTKAAGVAPLLDELGEARRAIRFGDNKISNAINATLTAVGGKDGQAYARAMSSLYKKDPALGGFYEYNALRTATKNNAKRLAQFRAKGGSVVGVLHDFAYKKGAPAQAKELVQRYFLNRQALESAQDATLSVAERELDDQARAVARRMTDLFDEYADEAQQVFGDKFQELDDYVPLMFSKEAKEALREQLPVVASGRGAREWKSLKGRTKFSTLEPDENGVMRRRWLNPAEANARVRAADRTVLEDVFETDPMELLVNYSEGMSRALSQRRFVQELQNRGVLRQVGRGVTYQPNVERVLMAARGVDETVFNNLSVEDFTTKFLQLLDPTDANDINLVSDMVNTLIDIQSGRLQSAQRLAAAAREGLGEAATDEAQKAAQATIARAERYAGTAKEALLAAKEAAGLIAAKREASSRGLVGEMANKFIAQQVGSDADLLRYARSLDEASEFIASKAGADEALLETAAGLRETAAGISDQIGQIDEAGSFTRAGILSVTPQVDMAGQVLAARGLRAVGQGVAGAVVPDMLQDNFATELILDSVNKMVVLNRAKTPLRKTVEEAYDNYMRFWRASATFGRGPGFAIRNAQSGLWQNFMLGVTGGDYKVANAIVQGRRQALKKAEDLKLFGADLEDFVERELADSLSKVRVGRGNAYDVYVAARDEGQVFDAFNILPAYEGENLSEGVRRYAGAELSIIDPNKTREELGRLGKAADTVAGSNPLGKSTKTINTYAEQYLRTAAISNGVRKYGADEAGKELASLLMKGTHFDYSNLSDFERKYMRNILPFYTWTRNSIPLAFRSIIYEPGKINAFMRLNENAKEAFGTDEAMYNEWMPEWINEKFGWAIGSKIAGKQLTIGPESPIFDLEKYFGAKGVPDIMEFVGGTSPVIRAPIEALTRKDIVTGASYKEGGKTAPAWLQALGAVPVVGGVAERAFDVRLSPEGEQVAGQGRLDFVRDAIPTIGVMERLFGLGDQDQRDRWLSNFGSQILGLNTATLTEEQIAGELRSRVGEIGAQIDRAVGDMGLDEQMVRDSVRRVGPELTAQFIEQGYFKRP
jgi:hypothetical protein